MLGCNVHPLKGKGDIVFDQDHIGVQVACLEHCISWYKDGLLPTYTNIIGTGEKVY